jgi:hypothetical protein
LTLGDPTGTVAAVPLLEICTEAPEVCALGAIAAGIGGVIVGKSAAERAVEGSINWINQNESSGDEGEHELQEKELERENCGEIAPNFGDPTQPPGEGWEWKGNGPVGSKEGA